MPRYAPLNVKIDAIGIILINSFTVVVSRIEAVPHPPKYTRNSQMLCEMK